MSAWTPSEKWESETFFIKSTPESPISCNVEHSIMTNKAPNSLRSVHIAPHIEILVFH